MLKEASMTGMKRVSIKLLRGFTTRELIDVLSHKFYPSQGRPSLTVEDSKPSSKRAIAHKHKADSRAAHVPALEVAISTHAKHFLAQSLVV